MIYMAGILPHPAERNRENSPGFRMARGGAPCAPWRKMRGWRAGSPASSGVRRGRTGGRGGQALGRELAIPARPLAPVSA